MQERIIKLLTRKIAGEATQSELRELHELISRYPDSVYYEEVLKQLWIPSHEETDLDQLYHQHKLKFNSELEFKEEKNEIQNYSFNKYKNPVFVFCSLLVVSILGFLFFRDINRKSADSPNTYISTDINIKGNNSDSLNTHITAGKGMRKKIKLPDGTLVWLNADSKLSYDMDMKQKEQRSVTLTGEASFDVTHDKKHPFIVHTDKIAVKVLGTVFNIKAYPGDKKSVTTLLRGSIELSVNSRPQQKIILSPSEKFTLIENKKDISDQIGTVEASKDITLVLANIDPVKIGNKKYIEETSWIENKLVFQNESFEELVPKLERWYNVRIQLNEQNIKSQRFTGVFTNENIQQALTAMQLIKSFNFKIKEHDVIIY